MTSLFVLSMMMWFCRISTLDGTTTAWRFYISAGGRGYGMRIRRGSPVSRYGVGFPILVSMSEVKDVVFFGSPGMFLRIVELPNI